LSVSAKELAVHKYTVEQEMDNEEKNKVQMTTKETLKIECQIKQAKWEEVIIPNSA
jgi:hypothetical protein